MNPTAQHFNLLDLILCCLVMAVVFTLIMAAWSYIAECLQNKSVAAPRPPLPLEPPHGYGDIFNEDKPHY